MYPAAIDEYQSPVTVAEVLELMDRYGESGKLIAGGQSLVPMMRLRFVRPECLIDLNAVSGQDGSALRGIREGEQGLEVGALATHAAVATDPLVVAHVPVLADVAGRVADLQVRNRGTIGGSLAHADHAADYPPVALALEATFEVQSSSGSRRVAADDFFVGSLVTALEPTELLTTIIFPFAPSSSGAAYLKHSVVAGDFAIANVCTYVELGSDGAVAKARIAVGGVLPRAILATRAAEALTANDPGAAAEAGHIAAEDVPSFDDMRASAEFRSTLIGAAVTATAEAALAAARGREAHGS